MFWPMACKAKSAGALGKDLFLRDNRGEAQGESTVSPPSLYLPSHTPSPFPLGNVVQ